MFPATRSGLNGLTTTFATLCSTVSSLDVMAATVRMRVRKCLLPSLSHVRFVQWLASFSFFQEFRLCLVQKPSVACDLFDSVTHVMLSSAVSFQTCVVTDVSPRVCTLHATCSDTADSFLCTCDDGYEDDGLGGCQDVNECDAVPCSVYAGCDNTEGSFTCTCNPSFAGDGFSCLKDECAMITLHLCNGQEFTDASCQASLGLDCQSIASFLGNDGGCNAEFGCSQFGCDGGDCPGCPSVPSAFVLPREYCSCIFSFSPPLPGKINPTRVNCSQIHGCIHRM